MRLLELSITDPALNLAVDEALLDEAEASAEPLETLRLWQFASPTVVVGRASKIRDEVDLEFCERAGIPILRRSSGGTAVTVGPGCLLYSLILSTQQRPDLKQIDTVHRYVMESLSVHLGRHLGNIAFQGTCDLTWRDRKFSGNSLRVARQSVLYHGTVLFDFPLELIHATLGTPPRQPEYRDGRTHGEFVINLPLPPDRLRDAVAQAFAATETTVEWPEAAAKRLVEQRYGHDQWNLRH